MPKWWSSFLDAALPLKRVGFPSHSNIKVFLDADVPLAGIAKNRHDVLAGAQLLSDLLSGKHVGPRRDPDEQSFHLRQLLSRLVRFVVRHLDDAIENFPIQDLGNESSPNPLDFVWPRFTAGKYRRSCRFNCDDLDVRVSFLEDLSTP